MNETYDNNRPKQKHSLELLWLWGKRLAYVHLWIAEKSKSNITVRTVSSSLMSLTRSSIRNHPMRMRISTYAHSPFPSAVYCMPSTGRVSNIRNSNAKDLGTYYFYLNWEAILISGWRNAATAVAKRNTEQIITNFNNQISCSKFD